MTPLNRHMTQQEGEVFSLVLAAEGIEHHLRKQADGWDILVSPEEHDRAEDVIRAYLDENRETARPDQVDFRPVLRTHAGWGMALVLAACHAATTAAGKDEIHEQLKMSAFSVLQGDYHRCVTALLMHADLLHLLGNMAGIGLFGTWVCQYAGAGAGIGLIVLSGALGNYMNAAFYQYGHSSLGASTAVFGALGVLVGIRFLDRLRVAGHRRKAWIQIAAGMSLLAFLGASARTDVTAHLFGFVAGTGTGAVFALVASQPPNRRIQFNILMTTLLLIAVSVYRGLSV